MLQRHAAFHSFLLLILRGWARNKIQLEGNILFKLFMGITNLTLTFWTQILWVYCDFIQRHSCLPCNACEIKL